MKSLLILAVILSVIGVLDTGYLSYARFTDTDLTCGVVLEGCNVVASSPYSELFGLFPLAYLGFGFYLSILLVAGALLWQRSPFSVNLFVFLALFGFLSSVYFVYLQLFVIKAVCIYCVISAILATILCIAGFRMRHVFLRTLAADREKFSERHLDQK